ncbi:hypothetical protein ACLOJK_030843 [Asimina triloba]
MAKVLDCILSTIIVTLQTQNSTKVTGHGPKYYFPQDQPLGSAPGPPASRLGLDLSLSSLASLRALLSTP